ncbi:MAG: hypothetical protein ABR499_21635 [Gemmatimonadaceae bacterium]
MATPEHPDDVRPALQQAEAKLAQHLEEACEDYDRENIGEESTDELLKLEEELLAAARAADEAVRLRRRLGKASQASATEPTTPPPADASPEPFTTRVREFRTASGIEWRVWEVRPGTGGRPLKIELYPADYAQGWLTFELIQGEGRKRLPKFAADWTRAADADLERLLNEAVEVPKRKPRGPADQEGRS